MSSSQPSKPRFTRGLIYLALLVVVGLWTYRSALVAAFVLDDVPCIVLNRALDGWQVAGPNVPYGMVRRPMGQLSLAASVHLFGRNPIAMHAINMLIHVAAALALYGLVRRILELPGISPRLAERSHDLAFATALVWLVHPLNTQAVTYAVQRIESQMALCYLLCLYALVRGSQSQRAWSWYCLSVAAFALGVGSKEVMATALVVAPLVDRVYLASSWRDVLRRRGIVYAGMVLCAVAWGAFTLWTQSQHHKPVSYGEYLASPWEYLRTQPEVLLHYLRLAFWPDELCFDYWWPIATSPLAIFGKGALVLAIVGVSFAGMFIAPRVALPALAGFLILAPSSSFIPLPDPAVEYRMYLSLACFCVVAVLAVDQLLWRCLPTSVSRDAVCILLLTLVVVGLSSRTNSRNRDYQNAIALWKQTAEQAPHNPRAHYNVARHIEQGIQEKPALADKYRPEIIARYRQAIAVRPDYVLAHASLASVLGHSGDVEGAIAEFKEALRLEPKRSQTLDNYGNLMTRQGRLDEAIALYREAIKANPDYLSAYSNLGSVLTDLGRSQEAAQVLRESLRRNPQQLEVARKLVWLLATADDQAARNGSEAVRLAVQLQQATAQANYQIGDTLAAAYAENREFDQAVAAAEKARDQAAAQGHMKAAEEISDRIALYRKGEPFRQARPAKAAKPANAAAGETISPQRT